MSASGVGPWFHAQECSVEMSQSVRVGVGCREETSRLRWVEVIWEVLQILGREYYPFRIDARARSVGRGGVFSSMCA